MKNPKHTTNIVSALTAKTQLGQIMRRATQKNERFVVDRRGEPSVIIMSVKDYAHSIGAPQWLMDAHAQAVRHGLDKLTMRDIDKVIADVRRESKRKPAMK